MTITIVISGLVMLSIFLMFGGIALTRRNETVSERLDIYLATGHTDKPLTLQELELSEPFYDRVILPLVKRTARIFSWMWPQNRLNALRTRLIMAGSPSGITESDFVGIKAISCLLVTSLSIFFGVITKYPLNFTSIVLLLVMALCGFFIPDAWLSRRIRFRQTSLINSLPDALDMLTIAIEAGLSFENALQEITAKWTNELAREFARVLRDIGMGQPRRQALVGMSERTGVADITSFVSALNQAEDLGVSIGRVLSVQAEELRVKRRQRAQERANQAPIKMMFPLVFLIFPAIFAVLLGPAVPLIFESFGGI